MTASLVLALTTLLVQATPAPLPSATPPVDDIRRGPATEPRMINSYHPGTATIVNSGSTNAAGYRIAIRPDASADVTVAGTTERATIGAPQARWLFLKLRGARPLAELAGGSCMKSMSFGTSTTIAFDGETTPDLSCPGDATTRELGRIADVIVARLHISTLRPRAMPAP
ncbi:MAG: hypothetical protein NVSMB21_05850 [Vulcanimicrobiaceae bacterium]